MEDALGRPRSECQALLWAVMESMNWRKAGLPKREPPWSVGGQSLIVSSIESRMERIWWMEGCADVRSMEEIFRSAADSEREKTNERIRE